MLKPCILMLSKIFQCQIGIDAELHNWASTEVFKRDYPYIEVEVKKLDDHYKGS